MHLQNVKKSRRKLNLDNTDVRVQLQIQEDRYRSGKIIKIRDAEYTTRYKS